MSRLLATNIGNTRVGLGLFELPPAAEASPAPVLVASFPLPDAGAFSAEFKSNQPVDTAVIASVNPPHDRAVAKWIEAAFGPKPLRFPADLPAPIEVRCDSPDAVGADRLANAVAAWAEFRAACIVVDAGSAVTVDAVSADGAFVGGAIIPGVALSARALAEGTALLPELEIAGSEAAIGSSTAAAMASGVLRGLAGAVDRLVAEIGEELGGAGHVLATGGDAGRLAQLCRTKFEPRPHLALTGLAVAYLRSTVVR